MDSHQEIQLNKEIRKTEHDSATTPSLPEKAKINYFFVALITLVCASVIGFGYSYFLQLQKKLTPSKAQSQPPLPTSPFITEIPEEVDEKFAANPNNESSLVTLKPSIAKKVIALSGWETFTAEDPDFGVKTTMAMPPGYTFSFTGSEFTIQNNDTTELWDYSSSIYRNNEGVLKNHYDGSSRRAWYQKRLSEKQSTDKILKVTEKPLNGTSYLEIQVQTPAYNNSGEISGSKTGLHFIFVQNNILHMIIPASNKAYTAEAKIPNNIELILASLNSTQTK